MAGRSENDVSTRSHMDETDAMHAVNIAHATVVRVLVLHGPDDDARDRVLLLRNEPLTVGRGAGPEPSLTVADGKISRQHVRFEPTDVADEWRVVDLESRNATYLNGERVDSATLADGSVVRIGDTILLFEQHTLRRDERLEPEHPPLLGPSVAMQRVRAAVALVAEKPLPVLIIGESGVGKDLAAQEIHRRSGRTGPFIPVNCGALPENLVESELFGHVAGAFTGATQRSEGLLAAARGGTVFLDEIGEMPRGTQAKLLRALDTGEVRPVGSTERHHVDVRFVAATNRDLGLAISRGEFRGDLHARLSTFVLDIPPLAKRREDILALAAMIMKRRGARAPLSADVAEALLLHAWPFNFRELDQVVSTALLASHGEPLIEIAHLPPALRSLVGPRTVRMASFSVAPVPIEFAVRRDRRPSREELLQLFEHFAGNVSKVAEFFAKDRRQIYRWAEQLGVEIAQRDPR